MRSWQNYIDGEWLGEADTMNARNPATGQTIGTLPKSSRATARRAIEAARKAQRAWAARSAWERAEVCRAIAGAIDGRRSEIARVVSEEQGKPLAEAMGEVGKAADGFRLAASLVTHDAR